jgi:hypothetical protein
MLKPIVPHQGPEALNYSDATIPDHNAAFHRCTLDLSGQPAGAQCRVGRAPLGDIVDLALRETEIVGRWRSAG